MRIHSVEVGDLVLTVSKEANIDTSRRVKSLHGDDVTCKTVDSYLLNSRQPYEKVYLEEGLMCHPGVIDLVAAYSECEQLLVYGDRQQIPFIVRIPSFCVTEPIYSSFEKIEQRNISRRYPQDVG